MTSQRILVIDDSPANLKLIRVLLTLEGYAVLTAPDAETALSIIGNQSPALILMDIQLPGMDGLTLTRHLKADARTRSIPVIAITAYAMKGDDDKVLEAGCDAYVTKPIDTRKLPSLISKYLNKHA